jgi:tetratricopeptide (TPR) repeat protein
VPELSLCSAKVETSQTVSVTELSDIFNGKNKGLVYNVDEAGRFQRHNATYNYRKPPRGQIPWRDLDRTFFGWSESPLSKEVYVFPSSVVSSSSSLPFLRKDTMASLENQETDLLGRLHKLETLLLPKHPGVIATKEALARVYGDQGKMQESLNIFHDVYEQKSSIWGSTHVSSLSTRLSIARMLLRQQLFKTGLNFVEDIISDIKDNVSPEHEIAVAAAVTKAYFLVNLRNLEEAERIFRQSLQIRLNNHGPKDGRTLELMRMLGVSLVEGNHARAPRAEKLFRTAIQILNEASDTYEVAMCQAAADLSWVLRTLQLYDDSYQVGQAALLKFEASLGPRHPVVLEIRRGLGFGLYKQSKFAESEREFRCLLELESQSRDQRTLDIAFTENYLAQVLWELNRFEEAISLFKRVLRGYVEVFGPEHRASWEFCDKLGRCYEQQERKEYAVELYQQMIQMIQERGFSAHPAIAEYTTRIERLTTAAGSDFL